ncbi:MAG: hypothetical protein WC223_10795 [Bacteroidales bacterium]|jgi:hypothetical protein
MKFFDVYTKRVYEKDGEKKEVSYRAGLMKLTEKGSIYLRLFNNPNVDYYICERVPSIPVIDAEK